MDIEKAKEICKAYINAIDTFGTINYKCINNLYEPIEVVLSELEKKDKKIEHLEKLNKFQSKDIKEAVDYTFELNKELEKKESIINEMAIYINNFDIDEDICKKVDEPCKNYAGENGKLCNECIIDYFTKKVEGK